MNHGQPTEPKVVLGPQALNTHFFDGKLGNLTPFLFEDIQCAATKTKDEKHKAFLALVEVIVPLASSNALKSLWGIINSHALNGREKGCNYDPVNNLFACDLLYLLYKKICLEKSEEHLSLLLTQLNEMKNGFCQSGRTIRLFQALIMLREDID